MDDAKKAEEEAVRFLQTNSQYTIQKEHLPQSESPGPQSLSTPKNESPRKRNKFLQIFFK